MTRRHKITKRTKMISVRTKTGNKITWFPTTKGGQKALSKFKRDNKNESYKYIKLKITAKNILKGRKGI